MIAAMKRRASLEIIRSQHELWSLSQAIYSYPEIGHEEKFASELLSSYLEAKGFQVIRGFAGMPTCFHAWYKGPRDGPRVAFLAEYDALPELGHACGHNLIGAASVGAGLGVIPVVRSVGGEVHVFGTPAEETDGAKVILVEKGAFRGLDAAMMFHPGDDNAVEVSSLALEALEVVFKGRAVHAVMVGNGALGALDGMICFFNAISHLRSTLSYPNQVHGVITDGGVCPNVVPEKTAARFYIRARDKAALSDLVRRVVDCARQAALSTGTEVFWHNYERGYDNMITNRTLARLFTSNLKELGIDCKSGPRNTLGSLDMGNVSHVVPALHPYLSLGPGLIPHTREFAQAAGSPQAGELVIRAAQALAWTAIDIFMRAELVREMWEEFRQHVRT